MKLGIMQSYFFPYIGYFHLIKSVDKFILYENVSFRKRSWITRNKLLKKGSGQPYFINVLVKKASSNQTIRQTKLCDDHAWREQLCRAIYHDYKRATFFDSIYPRIQVWLNNEQENLHEFNAEIIKEICALLAIDTPIFSNNDKYLGLEDEVGQLAESSGLSIKSQRVIEICQEENASTYINPIGGTDLYSKEDFGRHGIHLLFNKSDTPKPYNQFDYPFTPFLSVIDELMHKGPERISESLNTFELI